MEYEQKTLDIYKIDTEIDTVENINKKKIFILLECIIILICLILIIRYSINVINGYKVYKQYEAQLQSLLYQEQQKQEEINAEQERKRQERIPKLTDTRKIQH